MCTEVSTLFGESDAVVGLAKRWESTTFFIRNCWNYESDDLFRTSDLTKEPHPPFFFFFVHFISFYRLRHRNETKALFYFIPPSLKSLPLVLEYVFYKSFKCLTSALSIESSLSVIKSETSIIDYDPSSFSNWWSYHIESSLGCQTTSLFCFFFLSLSFH